MEIIRSVEEAARELGEDADFIQAIVQNNDNLSEGSLAIVQRAAGDVFTAVTEQGVDELRDMLEAARSTDREWRIFLRDFVEDAEIISRVEHTGPRIP